MKRRLVSGGRILWPVLLSLALLAGCGGDAEVTVVQPGGNTVAGTVLLPSGSGAPAPVAGIPVNATALLQADIVDINSIGALLIASANTDDNGAYSVNIGDRTVNDCDTGRILLYVDDVGDSGMTRAFARSEGIPVDINYVSETAVRLILQGVLQGKGSLCDVSNDDLEQILAAVSDATANAQGDTAQARNDSAFALAEASAEVQSVVDQAFSAAGTATPTATSTSTSTPATSTPTVPATSTPTVPPTFTPIPPSLTPTVPPTFTPTTVVIPSPPTSTPTETLTLPPTATLTPQPTDTATISPTPTEMPSRTPTVPPEANINVGTASGSPGDMVTVNVSLADSGGSLVVATGNDILYDSTQVDVNTFDVGGTTVVDCTVDPSIGGNPLKKDVSVSQPAPPPGSPPNTKVLRVAVLATGNVFAIPDGPLFSCNFVIQAGATPGAKVLQNIPSASDANGNLVPVGGSNGSITVVGGATETPTQVIVPTATETQVVVVPTATATQVPTETATQVVVPTATETQVIVPTETPTTASGPPTPTATSATGASINIGTASGNPGDTVTVNVSLAGSGGNLVVATGNDILYDSTQVDINTFEISGTTVYDCTVDPSIGGNPYKKDVSVSQPAPPPGSPPNTKVLRVAVLATGNVFPIPDGPLFSCNFVIQAGATPGVKTLQNVPSASDKDGNLLTVGGADGSITVSGGGGATATPTGITMPSETPTQVVPPTQTATEVPTETATVIPPTETPTEVIPPTDTPTLAPAATATPTTPSSPSINIGTVSGMPGDTVTVNVSLAGSGGNLVVATGNDILYDSTQVDVNTFEISGTTVYDCTVDPSIGGNPYKKDVSVSQPAPPPGSPANTKVLRVGVLATGNVFPIPDGPLFSCNFVIQPGATAGAKTLQNEPSASDKDGNLLTVTGSDGTITVQ